MLQDFDHLRDQVWPATDDSPPIKPLSPPFGYREPYSFEWREVTE